MYMLFLIPVFFMNLPVLASGFASLEYGAGRSHQHLIAAPIEVGFFSDVLRLGARPYSLIEKGHWATPGFDSMFKVAIPLGKKVDFFLGTGLDFLYTLGFTGALIVDTIINLPCALNENSGSCNAQSVATGPFIEKTNLRSFHFTTGFSILFENFTLTTAFTRQAFERDNNRSFLNYASVQAGVRF